MNLPSTKNLITTKDARILSGYTSDYLARLARSGKINGAHSGHAWLIDESSLLQFIAKQRIRKIARSKTLTEIRTSEYLRGAISPTKASSKLTKEKYRSEFFDPYENRLRSRALAGSAALAVLMVAYIGAVQTLPRVFTQAATVTEQVGIGFSEIVSGVESHVAHSTEASRERVVAAIENVSKKAQNEPISVTVDWLASPKLSQLALSIPETESHSQIVAFRPQIRVASQESIVDIRVPKSAQTLSGIDDSESRLANFVTQYGSLAFAVYNRGVYISAEHMLSVAALTRDLLATAPQIVTKVNLAFGSAIIDTTHALIRTDAELMYGLAHAGPASARATAMIIGGLGDSLFTASEVASINTKTAYIQSSLALQRTGLHLAQMAPLPLGKGVRALAAVAGALTVPEQTALTTYSVLHDFFTTATLTIARLFSPPTPVAVVATSTPPRVVATTPAPPAVVSSLPGSNVITSATSMTLRQSTYTTGISPFVLSQSLAALKIDILGTVAQMVNPLYARTNQVVYYRENHAAENSGITEIGTIGVLGGGTGITVAPVYGQVLMGDGSGGYSLVATSSLGITGSGGGSWGSILGTLSSQSDLQTALDSKLPLANWYATTTDGLREGTNNLYFSNARAQGAISATYPLVDTAGVFSLAYGTTTSNTWGGTQTFTSAPVIASYSGLIGSNNGSLYQVATSSLTIGGTAGNVTGTVAVTNGGTGQTSFTGNLLHYGAFSQVGTTTFTPSGEFSTTGSMGALVGGTNSTLALATNGIALTKLAQIAANTILGNLTGATGNVSAIATSTLYGSASTGGYVLQWSNTTNGLVLAATSTSSGTNYFTNSGANTYLTTGSNLGIGSTSPWAQLSVNPNGISGPAFVIGSSTGTSFVVTNAGLVGIGTANPGAGLDVSLNNSTNNTVGIRSLTYGIASEIGVQGVGSRNGGNPNLMVGVLGMGESASNQGIGGYFWVGGTERDMTVPAAAVRTDNAALIANNGSTGQSVFKAQVNNITRFIVSGVGTVGISTTSPTSVLTIAATSSASSLSLFDIQSPTPSGVATSSVFLVDANGKVGIATTTPWAQLSVNPNGISGPAFVIGSSTGTSLIVTNGGLVGIGTASPQTALDVSGVINITGTGSRITLPTSGATITFSDNGIINSTNGGLSLNSSLRVGSSVGVLTALAESNDFVVQHIIRSNDLVTKSLNIIGQGARPTAITNIVGGTIKITGGAGATASAAAANGGAVLIDGGQGFGSGASGSILLGTVNAGNVGIGTTSPTSKLQINGDLRLDGPSGFYSTISDVTGALDTNTVGTGGYQTWSLASSEKMRLNSTGFGIGITPTAKLHVASDSGGASTGIKLQQIANNATAALSYISTDFVIPTNGLIGQFLATANNYSSSINLPASSVALFAEDASGSLVLGAAGTSGDMRFNTGGYGVANERLRITSSGNVGIGTTTPGTLLSLGNTGVNTVNISTTATSTFGSGINILTGCFAVNGTCVSGGGAGGSGTVGSGTTGQFPYYAANGTTLSATSTLFLALSGNVGIGTTSPDSKFHVMDATNIATSPVYTSPAAFKISEGNGTTALLFDSNQIESIGGDLHLNFRATGGTGNNITMVVGGGKVGVGSTTPYAKLSVTGSGTGSGVNFETTNSSNAPLFRVRDDGITSIYSSVGTTRDNRILSLGTSNTTGNYITFYGAATNGATMHIATNYWSSDGALALGTYTTPDTLTLLPSGNTGIGTTTPWGQLSLNPNGITGPAFVIGSSTATKFIVTNAGNVGIGTTNPAGQFEVVDTAGVNLLRGVTVSQYGAGVQSPLMNFFKSRGTVASPAVVVTGDYAGVFNFTQYSGASNLITAGFGARINGTVTTTSVPTELFFYTSGGANDTDPYGNSHIRMLINAAGNVGIGSTTPGTLLSLGNTGANTVNISATATSTFGSGINVLTGCFAINGVCVAAGSGTNYFTNSGASTYLSTGSNLGIGSTTPWGQLSVNPSGITGPAFVIGSSSATNFVVTNGGNVGIGIANPTDQLVISKSQNAATNILLLNATSNSLAAANFTFGEANSGLHYGALSHFSRSYTPASVFDQAGATTLYGGGDGDLNLVSDNSKNIKFYTTSGTGTGYTEKVRIDVNGNVGIGVTPTHALTVSAPAQNSTAENIMQFGVSDSTGYFQLTNGTSLNSSFIPTISSKNANDNRYGLFATALVADAINTSALIPAYYFNATNRSNGSLTTVPIISFANNSNVAMSVWYDGSVKIGGTDIVDGGSVNGAVKPSAKLDIYSGTTEGVHIVTTNSSPFSLMLNNITFGSTDAKGFGFYQGNTGIAGIYNNNIEALNIGTTGNFGIGSTTPGTLLSLGNTGANTVNISATATSTFGSGINVLTGCFAINGVCVAAGSGTNYFTNSGASTYLSTGSNLGIGSTTPWGQLSVNPSGITGPAFVIGSSTGTSFVVTSGGNVGIGTMSPTAKLSVYDVSASLVNNETKAGASTGSAGSLSRNNNDSFVSNTAYGSGYVGTFLGGLTRANSGGLEIGNNFTSMGFIRVIDNIPLVIGTNDSERIRILANGNVGFGTTTPWGFHAINPNGVTGPEFVIGSSTRTDFLVTNAGSVGMGTLSPDFSSFGAGYTVLGMEGSTASVINLKRTTASSGVVDLGFISAYNGTTRVVDLDVQPDGATDSGLFKIWTKATGQSQAVAMTIKGNGNVGIGTTSPGTLLSLGNTGANTINISTTATSTFGSGINVLTGCFAINGTCVTAGGGSSSLTSTYVGYGSGGNALTGTSDFTYTTSSGSLAISKSIAGGNDMSITNLSNGATSYSLVRAISDASGYAGIFKFSTGYTTSGLVSASTAALSNTTGSLLLNNNTANPIIFAIGGSAASNEVLRLTSSNTVGIGSSTPWAQLSVNPTSAIGSAPAFVVGSSTGTSFVVTNSGAVGIGTTSPASILYVTGTGSSPLTLERLSGGVSYGRWDTVITTDPTGNSSNVYAAGSLTLRSLTPGTDFGIRAASSGAPQFTIKSNGNVGIGTTNPQNQFEVSSTTSGVSMAAISTLAAGYSQFTAGANDGTAPTVHNLTYNGSASGGTVFGLARANASLIYADGSALSGMGLGTTGAVGLTLGTNNLARLTIDSSGNVGIGTSSPATILDIAKSTNSGNFGTYPALRIINTLATQGDAASTFNYAAIRLGAGNGTVDTIIDNRYDTTFSGLEIRTTTSHPIAFGTAGIERMRIAANGSMGFSTTSPWGLYAINPSGVTGPEFVIGSSTKTDFVVSNGGLVGIGTASPQAQLEIVGSGVSQLLRNPIASSYASYRIYNDQNNPVRALEVGYGGSTYPSALVSGGITGESAYITTTGSYPLQFGTSNTFRMSILSGGNVGVGTIAPTTLLHVYGVSADREIRIDTTGANKSVIGLANAGTDYGQLYFDNATNNVSLLHKYTSGGLVLGTNSTERMRIDNAGNIGVGTTTPWGQLSVNPNAIGSAPAFVIGSSSATNFIVTNGGSVGVGTTSPGDKFANTSSNIFDQGGIGITGLGISWSVAAAGYLQAITNTSSNANANGLLVKVAGTASTNKVFTANVNGTDIFTILGSGNVGVGVNTPTAELHLKAGTTVANTAPLKFNSGSLLTTAEAGAVEFLTDKFYGTITTSAARKEFTMNDGALTSGRVPLITTNGRLTDSSAITYSGGSLSATSLTATGLTAGRVPYITTGGLLTDTASLYWDNVNGRLGINSASSPQNTLDIYSDINGGGVTLNRNGNAGSGAYALLGNSNGSSNIYLIKAGTGYTTVGLLAANDGAVLNATSGKLLIANGAVAPIIFTVGGTNASNEVMRLTTNGALGLGTTSPYALLSVVATSTTGVGSPAVLFTIASTTRGTSTSTLMAVLANGYVGIGTSSPLALLDMQGANSNAVVGSEIISTAADQDFSSATGNWTGTNWSIGGGVATHSAGANAFTLSNGALTAAPIAGHVYQISFTVNATATGTLAVSFGGTSGVTVGQDPTYGNDNEVQVIRATGTGALTFTASALWTGTLDNISIVEITTSNSVQIVRNSNGSTGLEIRSGGAGLDNAFFGTGAGSTNTTGNQNAFFGSQAGYANTTGTLNAFIGYQAGLSNTKGTENVFVGNAAGLKNTSGGDNTFVGMDSGYNNTIGYQNAFFGYSAGVSNTTGILNTYIGDQSGEFNTTGSSNSTLGEFAGGWNNGGSNNTMIGAYSGIGTNGGTVYSNNVSLGYRSGYALTTGGNNILLGYKAGDAITTGANNIVVGYDIDAPLASGSNQLTIGNLIFGTGLTGIGSTISDGKVGIGTTSPATLFEIGGNINNVTLGGYLNCTGFTSNANGLVACTASDQRLKQDISLMEEDSGLAAIDALNPVSFYWKPETNRGTKQQYGLIAQEVQNVFPNLVSVSNATELTPGGTLTVNYEGLISPMIYAIQQLHKKFDTQASSTAIRITSLEDRVAALESGAVGSSTSVQAVVSMLASAQNGIADLYAAIIHSKEVHTEKLCVSSDEGETCVTKEQLDALLSGLQPTGSSVPPPAPPTVTSIPLQEPDATADVDPSTEADATPADQSGEVPPPSVEDAVSPNLL